MTDDRAKKAHSPATDSGDELGHMQIAVLHPGTLDLGDRTVACEIIGISPDTVTVDTEAMLEPVFTLTLGVPSCGEFACDVTAQNERTLSLRHTRPTARCRELYQTLSENPEGASGIREFPRVQVLWQGRLRSGYGSTDCRVLNVSLGGALAQVMNPTEIISPVTLTIERFGDFACEIAWRQADTVGLKFLDSPEAIEATVGEALPQIRRNRS